MSRKRKHDGDEANGGLAAKKQRLLESRRKLPIWSRQKDIQDALRNGNVLVLSGETGSGKSTQIPQFLLDQRWCTGKIAITQPRRVAAITLARRVADEMGTPCGNSSPASKVGYSVRFDDSTGPSTRIKFLTEGMLLQEMLRDPKLEQYSCVIVDEVHERSVNVDLLLGFLKNLLAGNERQRPLKVVVMSATADVDAIVAFFATPVQSTINAVGNGHSENGGHGAAEKPNGMSTTSNLENDKTQMERAASKAVSKCHVEGRQYPVKLNYLDEPSDDVIDSALQCILKIHIKEPMPGDILVFMTGQESIQGLQKLVEEYTENLPTHIPKVLVLPLFAALPQSAQQQVFLPAPRWTRKVILSTNIAETSVTVPGVRFVIDTGKVKIKQFHNRLGMDSLLIKPISKSSADQRKGRAGREAAGQCFRLYTQTSYDELEKETKPELLRCDLSQAILNMKARGIQDVVSFPLLNPPQRASLEKAFLHLLQIGALEETGEVSTIGRQLARLPLSPSLGRALVEAARLSCLDEVIDIAACLSVENIFLNTDTEEAREQAQVARRQLLRRQGDHLTLLAAVKEYASEEVDRRRWADDHLISHRAMRRAMDVRKQLRSQCTSLFGTIDRDEDSAPRLSSEALEEAILTAFMHGFHANVARLCPDGSYKTFSNQTVAIHPSSVIFGRKAEAIMYNEFVYTNKAYGRVVSVVQLNWLHQILDQKLRGQSVV